MRRYQWKRNAVIATVLVFVCAAVYLNWRYAGEVDEGVEAVDAPMEGQSTKKVLGDAALVGGQVVTTDEESAQPTAGTYFDTARLSRQQSRDNALSLLREASAQEGAEQTALDEANRAIQTLAAYTTKESQIESLVMAKGYVDCVAFMGDESISVVVSTADDGLQTEDVAKITDIVLSETDYKADQIKIMEAK